MLAHQQGDLAQRVQLPKFRFLAVTFHQVDKFEFVFNLQFVERYVGSQRAGSGAGIQFHAGDFVIEVRLPLSLRGLEP